ncbi:hypothetical protein [Streptomyces sp. SID5910]|uniref:hypothetical protein n=1 Tax=Streptomyces sp. SID5910 TaxID=2690312 RepID=UPI0013695372|nr:hypothetical protein [Streptomyces sp. SID5910]MYR45134.1 hypothetical protein [Streptomyces sp. SID5910]
MTTRGRAFRFTAISALVVLSLTGFSTGRGHGHGHGGGDGGGGCSSSGQDHDSSSSSSDGDVYKDDGSDDSYGGGTSGGYGNGNSGSGSDSDYDDDNSGSGGSTGALQPATVELVSCATADDPYATVEITNPNDREYTFAVTVFFKDGGDVSLDDAREEATVPAGSATRVRLAFDAPGMTADHCELDDAAPLPLT